MEQNVKNLCVYTVSGEKSLGELAEAFCCSVDVLKALNGRLCVVLRPGDKVSVPCGFCPGGGFYRIRQGQTLFDISACTGIPLEELVKSNPGVDFEQCIEGQVIVLPLDKQKYLKSTKTYIVTREDTLPKLLIRLGTGLPLLAAMNPSADLFHLKEGTVLLTVDWSGRPAVRSYLMKEGEDLLRLTRRFSIRAAELLRVNPDMDPQDFRGGAVVNLPFTVKPE